MSTLKQIEANRRNALKSTGPVTPEGKDRSRRNALRHGLTSETVIAALEDANDYQAFEAAVTSDYDAETAVERELVLRLASVLWRLRRATGIESALFETVIDEGGEAKEPPPSIEAGDRSKVAHLFPSAGDRERDRKADIGNSFLCLAALPTFPLDRLSRYEYVLWRQARQIVFTLKSMRACKQSIGRPTFPFSFRRKSSDQER